MEKFFGKTTEEAVKNACEAFGVTEDELFYTVTFEKKTLFTMILGQMLKKFN